MEKMSEIIKMETQFGKLYPPEIFKKARNKGNFVHNHTSEFRLP